MSKSNLEKSEVTRTPAQITAMIHLTVPRDEIREVMGPGISEVYSTLAAQGITPAGPWLTHHLKMDPDTFDFEICVPIPTGVSAAGRVKPGLRPAMKVARTVYTGPYEGLGEAWSEFMDWIEASGLKPAADLWECYLAGPETDPDSSKWRTELCRPLID